MTFERVAPEQHDSIPDIPEPGENPHLFGHEAVSDHLVQAYRAGKLAHGLVLAGPVGIGKATLAFHLVHHVLAFPDHAQAPDRLVKPDPRSQLYRLMAQQAHPSLLHLTRPLNERTKGYKTAITVDEIRRIGRFLGMTSHDGGYRVVIVDAADDMNRNAANALLKNLEEPPARTLFIVIAHQPGRLLATIRSRCQVHTLKPLDDDTLHRVLQALPLGLPDDADAIGPMLARSGGSAREALLMSQFGGGDIVQAIGQIASGERFDVAKGWAVAEAVAGKDGEIRLQLFNRAVLDAFAGAAGHCARQGLLEKAERYARQWQAAGSQCADTDIYNLDRKQHAMSLLRKLHEMHQELAVPQGAAG